MNKDRKLPEYFSHGEERKQMWWLPTTACRFFFLKSSKLACNALYTHCTVTTTIITAGLLCFVHTLHSHHNHHHSRPLVLCTHIAQSPQPLSRLASCALYTHCTVTTTIITAGLLCFVHTLLSHHNHHHSWPLVLCTHTAQSPQPSSKLASCALYTHCLSLIHI